MLYTFIERGLKYLYCFRQPVVIYKTMKKLSTQLSMSLFLGIQPGQPEADEVSELMTTHWRGQYQVQKLITVHILYALSLLLLGNTDDTVIFLESTI